MDSGINCWKISPQIHLWVISLQKRPDDSILSLDERRKADMYIMEKDRIAYLCARSGLRKILSFYCNIPPQLLRFATSVYGKPYLIGNEIDESLAKVNLLIPPPGWNIETFKLEREGQDYIVTTAFFHRRNVVV